MAEHMAVILWIFGILVFSVTAVLSVISFLKAWKSGILAAAFSISWKVLIPVAVLLLISVVQCAGAVHTLTKRNAVIADSAIYGAQVILEYENMVGRVTFENAEEEASYIAQQTRNYQKQSARDELQASIHGMAMLLYLSFLLCSCGFITREGWYRLSALKAKRLLAEERGEVLVFYLEAMQSDSHSAKPAFIYKNTAQNRERFAWYL